MQGGRVRLHSWRQKIKRYRVAIEVVGIVLVIVIVLIIAGYRFDWTGFNGYNKVTIAHITSSPSAGTVTRTEEYQPGKALWDWMQLLIIPLVIAVGGFWLSQIQKSTKQRITTDNQREAALQAYIDKISDLLLEKHLRVSTESDEVRKIARVRTLTVLPVLDDKRKRSVLQFLHESGLIDKDKRIIDLEGADLMRASLWDSKLKSADLRGADLRGADLIWVDLEGADLREAELVGADLKLADGPRVLMER